MPISPHNARHPRGVDGQAARPSMSILKMEREFFLNSRDGDVGKHMRFRHRINVGKRKWQTGINIRIEEAANAALVHFDVLLAERTVTEQAFIHPSGMSPSKNGSIVGESNSVSCSGSVRMIGSGA